jgi:hypothetical protein
VSPLPPCTVTPCQRALSAPGARSGSQVPDTASHILLLLMPDFFLLLCLQSRLEGAA